MHPGPAVSGNSAAIRGKERRVRPLEVERFTLPVRLTVLAVAALCAAVTLAVALGSGSFAQESSQGRVAVEVTLAIVALLAVHLVGGRFAFGGRLHDLALVAALGALAATSVLFSAIPALGGSAHTGAFADWSPTLGRLIAAAALAVACFAPEVRLRDPRRAAAATAAAVALLVAFAAAAPGLLSLPEVGESLSTTGSDGAQLEGPAGYLILQLATGALFAAAALGFALRADRSRDQLLAWIGLSCVFAAVSRVHELLFPAGATADLLTSDLLRLAFGLALFAGAFGEIAAYQRRMAIGAVLDERRRMARDLHDGLAQELAYIKMETRRMAAGDPGGRAADVALAAERALDESRDAIEALRRRHDDPFALELSQVAEQLAARAGARLRLDLDARIEVAEAQRDPLLRIVREAVTNGVRHGKATELSLELSTHGGLRVSVRDNGVGFQPGGARRRGSFGLTTMRERAHALGGDLFVSSRPGEGTLVEVVVP